MHPGMLITVCDVLYEASALLHRRLNVLEACRVLVALNLASSNCLVRSDVRSVLHFGVVLLRGLNVDDDLGFGHCDGSVVALTRFGNAPGGRFLQISRLATQ